MVNPEGLRFPDEFVRHKILDAVGDLALAGLPIQGAYRSYCGGHRMNVGVLSALFADRANYAIVEAQGSRRETVLVRARRRPRHRRLRGRPLNPSLWPAGHSGQPILICRGLAAFVPESTVTV